MSRLGFAHAGYLHRSLRRGATQSRGTLRKCTCNSAIKCVGRRGEEGLRVEVVAQNTLSRWWLRAASRLNMSSRGAYLTDTGSGFCLKDSFLMGSSSLRACTSSNPCCAVASHGELGLGSSLAETTNHSSSSSSSSTEIKSYSVSVHQYISAFHDTKPWYGAMIAIIELLFHPRSTNQIFPSPLLSGFRGLHSAATALSTV